jgi:hypothetical protein
MLGTKCSFPFSVVLRSGKDQFDFLPVGVAFARVSGRPLAGIRGCWGSDFLSFGEGDCMRSCTHGAAIWGIFALFVCRPSCPRGFQVVWGGEGCGFLDLLLFMLVDES